MEQERELTSLESLELITGMINKAKNDYQDTGVSALFWGTIITICSLVTFFNYWWKINGLEYIWFLTFLGVYHQIMISRRERKMRRHKGHHDDVFSGIWISYAIAIFLVSFISIKFQYDQINCIYLLLYGIPTFATGYAKRYRPMIIGGIACWVLCIVSLFTPWPYEILLNAVAAQLAWFIPGLILRRSYLKAKQQHV